MERENFLPQFSDVVRLPDGRVKQIIAVCQGKKILIDVVNGQPKRRDTPEIPYFKIPDKQFRPFYNRIRGIISDGKKTAELFKSVKKLDWTANLAKCGITIGTDGKVIIPRRQTNKQTGEKKRVLMPAKDINSAIRMQDHIMEYYDSCLPAELNRLLKKLAIIQPQLELRREVLLYAKAQMQATIDEAYARFTRIAAVATDQNRPNFSGLTEKVAQLAFLLKNQWACPYLHDIKLTISRLNRAKNVAARKKLDLTLLHLLSAKPLLQALTRDKQQGGEKLSEIDPIKTLAEVDRRNKADEVLALAKLRLGGEVFRLADMLVISREVLEKKESVPRQEISRSAVLQTTISTPTTSRPPARCKKKIFNPSTEQAAFDFGA